nr:hypothetical protein [Variovorax boronicumulans]
MSDAAARNLIERLQAQRKHWVDVGAGRRVQFMRPPEVELPRLVHGVRIDHLKQYVCGWEGFTEATLLGAGVGSSDPVPFHADLWAEVVADDAKLLGDVAKALAGAAMTYMEQRAVIEKNSAPSST